MEYHEAIEFLFDLRRYPPAVGVESTRRLLDRLGRPDEDLRVVQVAGSNRKGSTARMVESVIREAGNDVGLYTSPHLDDVRERVRIDGRPVSKAAVTEFVERAGLDRSQIIVDPGLGFGKSAAESFELLGRLKEFEVLGCPILVGHSRKSMFGVVGRDSSEERLPATAAWS